MELKQIWREVNDKDKAKVESPLKSNQKISVLKIVLFTIIGIAGAVALGGYVISGGILPNAHTNDDVAVISSIGLEPGMLYGYVGGPIAGLPAIGASVIAEDIKTGHASNSLISVDGKYYLNLIPGEYNIIVAFPDGTTRTYHDVAIKRGTASEMNIKYG